MANNPTVTNSSASSNPDYAPRTTEIGGVHIQHIRLDLGAGAAEAQATGTVPVSDSDLVAFISGENMTDFSNSVAAIQTNTGAMAGDITGPNGSTLDELNGLLTVRVEEGATYTYIGHAIPGADESVAEWRIKRMTNANLTILFADGDVNFDNVWDDRATLTYL